MTEPRKNGATAMRVNVWESAMGWTAIIEPADWGLAIGSYRANHSIVRSRTRADLTPKIDAAVQRLQQRLARLREQAAARHVGHETWVEKS